MDDRELIRAALQARRRAYSPYSRFQVGAALLAASGKVYTGCNIENAAYSPSNCAERTAFFKAVSDGVYDFAAIAIAGGDKDARDLEICSPCGVCRQVMMEFCSPKTFRILLAKSEDEYEAFTLGELLPLGFGPGNLGISGKGAGEPGLAGLSGSGEGDEEYVPDSIKGPERGQGHD